MSEKRRDKGEGSIYQRKSDMKWVAKYTYATGAKPKTLYGSSEQEVKKKLREYKKEIAKNDFVEIQKVTVQSYMQKWFDDVKVNELKPKSLDALESTMAHQVFPHVGDMQIASIRASDIQTMIAALVKKEYAYSTIKKSYDAINSCFKLGVIKGDIVRNPCLGVSLPKNIAKKESDIRFFTKDEAEAICEMCLIEYPNGKPVFRLGHAIIVLVYTGMRIGELLGLKWDSIDYENKRAKVVESAVMTKDRSRTEGDENKPKYILLEQSDVKTDSSERYVHLNQKAIAALKEIHEINGKYPHVMATSSGKICTPRNIDRMLRNVLERCGFEPCGVHALRHTYASMLFKNGVDVKTVSELLGHSDVATTYNKYIHLIKEQKQQAVEILDDM